MKKIISLESFIQATKNKKYSNDIKLEVEGKFLKTANQLIIKKLVVPEKLLNDLGMEKQMIDGPTTKNPPKQSLRELVQEGFANVNNRLDNIETDVKVLKTDVKVLKTDVKVLKTDMVLVKNDIKSIKSLPTIQRELNAQKRVKKLTMK